MKALRLWLLMLALFPAGSLGAPITPAQDPEPPITPVFPLAIDRYEDDATPGIAAKLIHRAKMEPFNVLATLIFFCAIVHTFLASKFMAVSHRYQREFEKLEKHELHPEEGHRYSARLDQLQVRAQIFHFLGEVEAVFGIWIVPLGIALVLAKGWTTMVNYIAHVSYAEPVFEVAVMAIAASR
ncbi:MAG: hypothetical protein M3463_22915, partial [Verrucomicrobiota bacterium]|nr:hypothetical protein [Verrucomicrobiota bacterium]